MGKLFSAGGGPTAGTKRRAEQYKNEAYAGRNNISAMISELLGRQLSNIAGQSANASALAMASDARRFSGLTSGAIDSSGAQAALNAEGGLLNAQQNAYGQAQGAQINNMQDFLNQLFNYNQLLAKKKQPGIGRQIGGQLLGNTIGGVVGGPFGTALANLFKSTPEQTQPPAG